METKLVPVPKHLSLKTYIYIKLCVSRDYWGNNFQKEQIWKALGGFIRVNGLHWRDEKNVYKQK